jgi:hypothetical protein
VSDEVERRFEGVAVPAPEFAGDDGTIDPGLEAVLSAYDGGRVGMREVIEVLRGVRLMTPLVAVLDETEESPRGLRQEKSSHMASVSRVTADGRRGLLAFSCVAAMATWDPAARGIPAPAPRVAAAALEEGADAVLLDLGGPVRVAVRGTALSALSLGEPVPPAYEDPEVRAAVLDALSGLDGFAGARLEPPDDASEESAPDLVVLVRPAPGVDGPALAELAASRLVSHPVVAAACRRGVAVGIAGGSPA